MANLLRKLLGTTPQKKVLNNNTLLFVGLWNPDEKYKKTRHNIGADTLLRYLEKKGNMRDQATIQQLIVLSNMESMNAELIKQEIPQEQRILMLNKMAIEQLSSILENSTTLKAIQEKGR